MYVRHIALIGTAVFLFLLSTAAAQASYNYLEVSYQDTDIAVAEGDGFSLSGSWLWSEHWFLAGRYADATLSGPLNGVEVDADYEFIQLGIGYRSDFRWLENTDWYAVLAYNEIDLSHFEDETESGEDIQLGLRHQFSPRLEIDAALRYFNSNIECIDLLAGEAGLRAGALWRFSSRLGLSISYESIDKFDELVVGLRGQWH